MKGTYLLLVLFISLEIHGNASGYFYVERFLSNQGLPNNNIRTIEADQSGYLWLGTKNGLSRYNGYTFDNFYSGPNQISTLKDDNIHFIETNQTGDLFLLSDYGVEKFNNNLSYFDTLFSGGSNKYYIKLLFNQTDSALFIVSNNQVLKAGLAGNRLSTDIFYQIAEENQQIIGAALLNSDFYIATKNKIMRFSADEGLLKESISSREFLPRTAEFMDIQALADSTLLIRTTRKLFLYDLKDGQSRIQALSFTPNLVHQVVYTSIYGNLAEGLLASGNNLFLLNLLTGKLTRLNGFREISESGTIIQALHFDKSGVLWIGTTVGLYKYNTLNKIHIVPYSDLKIFDNNNSVLENTDRDYLILKDSRDKNYTIWGFNANKSILEIGELPLKGDLRFVRESDSSYLFNSSDGLSILRDGVVSRISVTDFVAFKGYDLCFGSSNTVFLACDSGIIQGRFNSSQNTISNTDYIFTDAGIKKLLYRKERLFGLADQGLYEIDLRYNISRKIFFSEQDNFSKEVSDLIVTTDSVLWIGTNEGIYSYDQKDSVVNVFNNQWHHHQVYHIVEGANQHIYISTDMGLAKISRKENKAYYFDQADGFDQFKFKEGPAVQFKDNYLCFPIEEGFLVFHPDSILNNKTPVKLAITKARLFSRGIESVRNIKVGDTLQVGSTVSYFQLDLSLLDFYSPQGNTYSYSLTRPRKPERWVDNGYQNSIIFSNLSSGIYKLKFRAKNSHGVDAINSPEIIVLIDTSFWLSQIAFFGYGVILLLVIYLSIFFRTRHLRRLNREYKEKEIIARQVERQKEELSIKNKNITDSIYYAKRIQMAMMPSKKIFTNLFPESFILHMPKDIVSGDFYWASQVDGRIFFSAVDCTGHGVPGAFMSIIGFELFRRITEIDKIAQPAEILNNLSANFERLFRDVEDFKLRDGMDLAFCAVDKEKKLLEFAGAFNPLYLIRDNSIMEIKGDRFSVGLNDEDGVVQRFSNHVVPLKAGDIIYIFTDGYADQFGGPDGKKYKYRRFRHLLLALHQLPMDRQEEFLKKSIIEWKADQDQVDDILVMGIRIS